MPVVNLSNLENVNGINFSLINNKVLKTRHTRFKKIEDEDLEKYSERAMDIEDMHKWANETGEGAGPCPYYFSRKLAEDSDIIFIPYNYIINGNIRKGFDNIFKSGNFILIFDEAHNIEVKELNS